MHLDTGHGTAVSSRFRQIVPPMSRNSAVLVLIAFLVTLGVFMLQPYLIARLPAYLNLDGDAVSLTLMIAAVLGAGAALVVATQIPPSALARSAQGSAAAIALSWLAITFAPSAPSFKFALLAASLLLYRFALALLRTCSYGIQLSSGADETAQPRILALILAASSAGAAIGPLLASQLPSFQAVLVVSDTSLALAALITLFLRTPAEPSTGLEPPTRQAGSGPFSAPILAVALSATLFIFLHAQMLSSIPLLLSRSFGDSAHALIGEMFALKAIITSVLSLPITYVVNRITGNLAGRYFTGIILSTIGIVLFTAFPGSFVGVILLVVALAAGEVVGSTNAILILKARVTDSRHLNAGIALFTFATAALGIGVGQYLGVLLVETGPCARAFAWISIGISSILLVALTGATGRTRAAGERPDGATVAIGRWNKLPARLRGGERTERIHRG